MQAKFQEQCEALFKRSHVEMLDFMYSTMVASGYINEAKLQLNKTFPPFLAPPFEHTFQITINLSKPEIIQPRSESEAKAQALGKIRNPLSS